MSFSTPYVAGIADLGDGLRHWRIWHLLGTADLRRRHARSRMGQLWITMSTGLTILALGLVWSLLWRLPVEDILPYIATAMVFWGFISTVITESTTGIVAIGNLFLNQKTTFSVAIFALIYKALITTAYNMAIVFLVFLFFWTWPDWRMVLLIPGLLLTVLFLIPASYVLAILATRFRDAVPLTQSITQIGYFITPVLWKPDFIPSDFIWINLVNPFAVFLSLLRDPLLAMQTPASVWLVAVAYVAGLWLVALPFIGRYHKRVIYWI